MHPPLAEHAHTRKLQPVHPHRSQPTQSFSFLAATTECSEVMKAIKDCHTNNPYLKFLGVCNDQKTALNMCLRQEVRCKLQHLASLLRYETRILTFSST